MLLLQHLKIFLQLTKLSKICMVVHCEWPRFFLKSKIYSFTWVKDKKAKLQQWDRALSIPAAGREPDVLRSNSHAQRGERSSCEIPPPPALGITHSFLMFSAYWHKFFSSHSVDFNYLKYHNQTAFKVLSLISFSKFCFNFVFSSSLVYSHPPKFFQTLLLDAVSRPMI